MEYQLFRGDYPVIFCVATGSEINVAELTNKLKELANQSRLDRDKTVVFTSITPSPPSGRILVGRSLVPRHPEQS